MDLLGPCMPFFLLSPVFSNSHQISPYQAMAAAALEIISLIHMKESYIPILLERKLQRNKRLHPDMDLYTVVELLSDLSTRRAGSFISSAIRPGMYLFDTKSNDFFC